MNELNELDEDISFIQIENPNGNIDWSINVVDLPDNSSHKIRATYGTDYYMVDVTKEALFCFKSYGELIIPMHYSFNEYFGDPTPNQIKKLVIEINDKVHTFGEYRQADIFLPLDNNINCSPVQLPQPMGPANAMEVVTI
jgi:hypothetical protein